MLRANGPFVSGLGRQVFILVTGVRFPYGLRNVLKRVFLSPEPKEEIDFLARSSRG